jgi:hypothetical protein
MRSSSDELRLVEVSEGENSESARIECHTSLSAYFHETLVRAFAVKGIEAPPPTEFYLVGLLEGLGHDTAPLSRTLVELSIEVENASRGEKLTRLRSVGDQALSVSGLFDVHLERRGISRSYVVDVGSRAYRSASQLASASSQSSERARASVFFDLSARFQTYAEVLEGVRESTALGTPDDVLSLYERFCKTRSPALAERLIAHGVVSVAGSDDVC